MIPFALMQRLVSNVSRPRRMRASAGLSAWLGVVLVTAGPFGHVAHAGSAATEDTESSRAARRMFQSAEVHFQAGRFNEALADYQAGYDAALLPGFLVNIAQCQRRLGDLKKARSTYQQFLLVAPDSPLGPDVKGIIVEIDQALQDSNDPQSGGVSPNDDMHRVPVPAAITSPQPAGKAQVPASLLITTQESAADRSTKPMTEPVAHPASRTRWWFWGTLAAIAVGGAVGAVVMWPSDAVVVHDGSLGTLRR